MKKINQQNTGFTLVEIMIVVAIISLLAAIAIPNFLQTREAGAVASCQYNLHTLNTAVMAYSARNGSWPTAIGQLATFCQNGSLPNGGNCATAAGGAYTMTGTPPVVSCPYPCDG